ncbi:hypothetical protein JTE90_008056 [Oedothorax gibbosus]|uniref:Uncharacterized protein n=1 Tax=Oedothorax gibbosus TaxID=931172 RepID=A0AAV6UYY9_9ARAC|nr:hypothetical protein JTE90_008056 [Oedothorax gibbosus]
MQTKLSNQCFHKQAEYQVPKEKPIPYHFSYEVQDNQGTHHRHEHGDGDGTVKGSYGFIDERGVHRLVNYIADHQGFRAHVMTNEPGTKSEDPSDVIMHSFAEDMSPEPHELENNSENYHHMPAESYEDNSENAHHMPSEPYDLQKDSENDHYLPAKPYELEKNSENDHHMSSEAYQLQTYREHSRQMSAEGYKIQKDNENDNHHFAHIDQSYVY